MILNARRLYREGNHTEFVLLAIEDVTERRVMEADIQSLLENLNAELTRQTGIAEVLQRPLLLEIAEDAFPGLSLATLYTSASKEADVGASVCGHRIR